ncbi:phosphatidate cytidylyltransferase [Methylotenera mobilis]|uniref:Phosphatidate cytidylyltransferase n=1 Tax=Methylotenera mobilis (strain JLW8 / ATCC BAA-1282 / DSM 17540) TaxID=583345 RepID=C6WVX0_METML|nr:phosphatidate cytidylyltransferase [Methylotenera mobilis]ACT48069.1 phosphatidate cytidylyltransferase [Methylotenera mobilis JLW8]
MLRTRVITAVLLVTGLLLTVFLASKPVWAIVMLGISLLAVTEWSHLIKLSRTQSVVYVVIAAITGIGLLSLPYTALASYQSHIQLSLLSLSALFWLVIAPAWLKQRKSCQHRFMMCVLGAVLIFATWVAFVELRTINPWLLIGAIATVSLADSAAYFAGKRFGRRKLAPNISPGKTWEGVLGALAAVTVYGSLLCYYQQISLWLVVALWLVVLFSVMGDLVESLMKRQAGLKDSGQLLPGHGGILDRIDGFIPTLPMILLAISLLHFSGFNVHG